MQSNDTPSPQWQPQENDSYTPPARVSSVQPVVTMRPDAAEPARPWVPPEVAAPALESTPAAPEQPIDESIVRWQATEYIHRNKGFGWYVIFTLIVLSLMTLAIFVMREVTFAVLIPVMAVALIVYSRRPPRMLEYTLSRQGLHVNDQLYPFGDFKGFGVIHDEEEYSVMLIPKKRFKLGVNVYFPEESGEAIVDMLGARLPMQDMRSDVIDTIIRKLRI